MFNIPYFVDCMLFGLLLILFKTILLGNYADIPFFFSLPKFNYFWLLGVFIAARAFSSCREWILLSSCGAWLIALASLVAEHGL